MPINYGSHHVDGEPLTTISTPTLQSASDDQRSKESQMPDQSYPSPAKRTRLRACYANFIGGKLGGREPVMTSNLRRRLAVTLIFAAAVSAAGIDIAIAQMPAR
jgi:hypothetical protein